ncbi:DUF6463 family protein [Chitinophaga deserti]|uniref:DUF6463 family protein n=1 Tax=Chitinophaga deserti TaxID=2164099 RepID=UPI000D6C7DDE|nr:DUF6463 family protein [Chitinophaga deserti]
MSSSKASITLSQKIVAPVIIFTSIVHLIYGFSINHHLAVAMWQEGLVNTAPVSAERLLFLWFELAGMLMLFIGLFLYHFTNRQRQTVPAVFGWFLLIIAATGCLFEMETGFYLFFPLGIMMVLGARQQKRQA